MTALDYDKHALRALWNAAYIPVQSPRNPRYERLVELGYAFIDERKDNFYQLTPSGRTLAARRSREGWQ